MKEAIEKHFTDYSGFKEAFRKAVQSRFQSGWVWLCVVLNSDGKIIITQTNNNDNPLMAGLEGPMSVPIIGLNLWEHAYWEGYEGVATTGYLDRFFEQVDWTKVSKNFEDVNVGGKVAPII